MKRVAAAALCLLLLLCLLPVRQAFANQKLHFIAVNEHLPSELINCVVEDRDGAVYVPCTVFTNYGMDFFYSYFASNSTAYLAREGSQMYFELNTGDTYDGNGFHYSTSALVWNGMVYLPIALVYRYFGGFSYSTITGNEYGDILRLKTDSVVLSDGEFLKAAGTAMRTYYEDYYSARAAEQPAAAPVTVSPAPAGNPEEDHQGEAVSVSFLGLPGDQTLETLEQARLRPCFFLTAEEIRRDPDLVRRLAGEGYPLGIYCREDPEREWSEASGLLFEAAWYRPILVSGAAEAGDASMPAGTVYCLFDFSTCPGDSGYVSPELLLPLLEESAGDVALRLNCDEMTEALLPRLLQYLVQQRYEIVSPRETG